jgi:KDO2-lipid IV(A) lauroyltransferase
VVREKEIVSRAAVRRKRAGLAVRLGRVLEFGLLSILFGILRTCPEAWALAFGNWLAGILFRLFKRRRQVGMTNLRIAFPEKSDAERTAILLASCRNLARVAVETIRLSTLKDDQILARVRYETGSLENLSRARSRGKGTIFLTAHIGNWELMALTHALHGNPMLLVARSLNNPHFDARIRALRSRGGNSLVTPDDGPGGIRRILDHLRKNGAVGVLADQCPQRKRGVPVPFFGKLAWSHRGPASLALRSDAAVLPVFIHPDPGGRGYSIRVDEELPFPGTGDREQDVKLLIASMQAAIEAEVRRAPEHWFWIHRRWKRSPDEVCSYPSIHRHRRRIPAGADSVPAPGARA